MVIKDFIYQSDSGVTELDDEAGDDNLEYPGGTVKSLICPFFLTTLNDLDTFGRSALSQ